MRAPTVAPATDLGPRVFSRDIDDFVVPNGREEEWRFAPIKKLGDVLEADGYETYTAAARV